MSEQKRKSTVLESCLAKPAMLAELIDYADGSIVSKTIIDKSVGTITLFAFDKGQNLSEHTAPYDAVLQVLDGKAQLSIGGKHIDVSAGQLIIMPANIPHAVVAKERFKMLLTMVRM
ncbi:MAG: cupin domain-containing protein [Sedimentisphaerales bacterium]|nr:cupin domain-containing protein [Sedimentisphaerales bacterium]